MDPWLIHVWVHACLVVFANYWLPQLSFSFRQLRPWLGMHLMCFCFPRVGLGVWKFGSWVPLPPCSRALQSPSTLEVRCGGCRSQGCHGYPSRLARIDAGLHLPYFRHHSPSSSIVDEFNNDIITLSRKTRYFSVHFKILTKTRQFAKQTENSLSSTIGPGVTLHSFKLGGSAPSSTYLSFIITEKVPLSYTFN